MKQQFLQDKAFQGEVQKGKMTQIPDTEPAWKPMSRGVTMNNDDLKDFLDMDFAEILLHTFVDKKEVKKYIEGLVSYLCTKKEEIILLLFQEYKKASKREITQSLKMHLDDFIAEHPDIDFMRISRELPIIMSLLYLKQEGYNGLL